MDKLRRYVSVLGESFAIFSPNILKVNLNYPARAFLRQELTLDNRKIHSKLKSPRLQRRNLGEQNKHTSRLHPAVKRPKAH